jgi:hypothetical protein
MTTVQLSTEEINKMIRLKEQRLTANRKFSQMNKEKMKSAYKSWYEKNKIDPEWVEKKRERERVGYKRRKELNHRCLKRLLQNYYYIKKKDLLLI